MRDAFVEALELVAERDPRIFLITADLGFGVLDGFARRRRGQYLNVGVAEQNMTGLATGLALGGRTVFTYSIANFPILRCLEQVRNDVAYHGVSVKIVAIGGGFSYGALGFSHHATEDLAILRAIPGMTVLAPCDNWEVRQLVPLLVETPGPAYLRLDKSPASDTHRPGEALVLGRMRRLRDGDDITLMATGGILGPVTRAAEELGARGIGCRLLAVHAIKPLDTDAIVAAARETGGIVTIEEHGVDGGLGSAVAETLLDAGAAPRMFRRLGLPNAFAAVGGSQDYLRKLHRLDELSLVNAVRDLVAAPRAVNVGL